MMHEFLLYPHRCTDRIKPCAVCVPERVAAEMAEASGVSGPL